ncbi:MAG: hypothetical protein IH939_11230 [Acidobacteria bacterium]|nr:hypothetical protein [Acidobacteriota bacterium]
MLASHMRHSAHSPAARLGGIEAPLEAGDDPQGTEPSGCPTARHGRRRRGHRHMVELLLDAGKHPRLQTPYGTRR